MANFILLKVLKYVIFSDRLSNVKENTCFVCSSVFKEIHTVHEIKTKHVFYIKRLYSFFHIQMKSFDRQTLKFVSSIVTAGNKIKKCLAHHFFG